MRRDGDRCDWRWYLLVLAALAVLWTILGWAAYGVYAYLNPPACRGGVMSDKIKAKVRYHGVEVAYEDWKGNVYFIRNGKKCPL